MKVAILLLFVSILTLANTPSVKWGTYYYGTGNGITAPLAIAHDGFGHVYICGRTYDPGLGTQGTFQENLLTDSGGFIAKFDTSGNRLWATYYTNVQLNDIVCDEVGNIYVTGTTNDGISNWIVTPDADIPNSNGAFEVIIAKFDSSGNRVWATYYGGEDADEGHSISISGSSVYVSGITYSLNGIAFMNQFQPYYFANGDAFLVKFDTAGNRLWGTFCGGNGQEVIGDHCSDDNGNVYLVFGTSSTNYIATPGSYQPTKEPDSDGFLIKFNSFGQRLWGTYYGGEGPDAFSSITLGADGNLYILGSSGSDIANGSTYNITTPGCYQAQPTGAQDPLIVKFTPDGQRIWGTYYSNAGNDITYNHGLCSDGLSNIYLVLAVDSPGFPIQQPLQPGFGGQGDGVIAKFDSSGAYKWGSYYGGSNNDMAYACTADDNGNVYFCGYTYSLDNIATPGSFISTNVTNGSGSTFFVRVDSSGLVKVNSISSDERIMIYPNPVTEILSIESSSVGYGFLYSIDGKEVMSFFLGKGKNDIAMPQQLSPGVYVIRCRLANGELLNHTIVYRK